MTSGDELVPATQPAPDDQLPDTALFWRWVGAATRPVVGWVLVGIGALIILFGYLGVANEALVAKQLPYLISGGIGGIAFVAVGTYFLGTEEIRRDSGRLDRLERMVAELHTLLLTATESERLPGESSDEPLRANGAPRSEGTRLRAMPGGERYHRDGCVALEGKSGAATVSPATIRRRALTPCPLCEPVLADA